ncbi:hypothetical protein C8F01DRAFT_6216 [Mycena amicta]|nr:hypothetical protein C8F01DRAFT_6216 [Mycena amicta]
MDMSGSTSTPELRAADRTRLSTLDAHIEQLQITLTSLCAERTLIQDRLDSYTYPVLTLPNEIVSEIFIQYLPRYPACPPLLGDSSPTKLAQICKHWREIAHSTPMLWRAIQLFFYGPLSAVPKLQLAAAQVWLERSRSLPLSIRMGAYAYDSADLRAEAINHLVAHRTRWQYIMLDLPIEDDLDHHCVVGSMPLLLQLDLRFGSDESRLDATVGSVDVPRLHTAFLDCCNLLMINLGKLLPWGQLQRLFLSYVNTTTAATVLRETTNLVHCRLELEDESWDSHVQLHLPRLETLIIPGNLFINFLVTLRTPALKTLHLNANLIWPRTDENVPLVSVVRAFGCTLLERLSITNAHNSLAEYNAALPEVACIEFLEVFSKEEWGN